MELQEVTTLIEHLNKLRAEQEELEKQLKIKKKEVIRFGEQVIPDLFKEENLSELALADGRKVIIKPHIHCSVPEARKAAAMAWLREHGHAELIKSQAVASFSTSEVDQVNRELLLRLCAENELTVDVKDSIHPQTLKSWVKGMKEGETPFPEELFGVYERRETLVK